MNQLQILLQDVSLCRICEPHLPLGPKPILQVHHRARILIAGQAPGRRTHESGKPFDDASGKRLRKWLGISDEKFYDAKKVAILPMAFCFPGSGSSGDLAPRAECAATWRKPLLKQLGNIQLTLVVGQYAQQFHFPGSKVSLTEQVRSWRQHWPDLLPLPHPSPRNNQWLRRNPWFEAEVLPVLQLCVQALI